MNKYITVFAIFLFCIFGTTPSLAQDWSLEQCISYAWEHNINLQQQGLATEQYENSLFQSKMNFVPRVGINASYNMNWGWATLERIITDASGTYTISVQEQIATQNFSPSISASINLFEGLKKINTLRYNQSNLKAAEQDLELMRNNIALWVAQAYLQVLLSKEMLTVAENSCQNIENQLNRVKQLVAAGSRPHSEQLDMEAQLAAEEMQRVMAENKLTADYLTLRQHLNLQEQAEFEIALPVINIDDQGLGSNDVNSIYSAAQGLPQIKGAEFRMQSAKHNWNIARGNYWPTLSISAFFGSGYSNPYYDIHGSSVNFWDQLTNRRGHGIGFNLSIPILNNWSIHTNAKNARLNYHSAQLEVEKQQQTLLKEIQTAANEASASYNKYKAANRNVTASQESFRYVEQKFETGLLTATDYNVAKTNLLKAQSEEAQSKYQYVFQLKVLDLYKGLPIKL
ncbi:MAG: TolC family protein [Bacteroidales bacterium]|nr:TolC family protein [Bacteroidales bacterium]MCL2133243.1 TolC family protein [Bacteroidales bacterium]